MGDELYLQKNQKNIERMHVYVCKCVKNCVVEWIRSRVL